MEDGHRFRGREATGFVLRNLPGAEHALTDSYVERKEGMAHPLLGYHLIVNPQQPTTAIIAFHVQEGDHYFAATREILEQLAAAFQRQAAKMPRKKDQN
jgi:hypothetical protein